MITTSVPLNFDFDASVAEKVRRHAQAIYCHTDRMFAGLMLFQWVGCIAAVLIVSPRTWIGSTPHLNEHLWFALAVGGILCTLQIWFAYKLPGRTVTRMVVACAQM